MGPVPQTVFDSHEIIVRIRVDTLSPGTLVLHIVNEQ